MAESLADAKGDTQDNPLDLQNVQVTTLKNFLSYLGVQALVCLSPQTHSYVV